jgi:prepilin-type N-terminal cleavage/methylation domain-containing protein
MSTPRRATAGSEGFTLVELLVALAILGIIMGAIGAMITTGFRTTETVSSELNGSRAPKVVSRYWTPDVEQAALVLPGAAGCGSGTPVVTFASTAFASNVGTPDRPADPGATRTVTWSMQRTGARDQLVRFVCAPGAPVDRTVVVSDLQSPDPRTPAGTVNVVTPVAPSREYAIEVAVPDRSRGSGQFTFSVVATDQVTP